jgi:hypothetical protein
VAHAVAVTQEARGTLTPSPRRKRARIPSAPAASQAGDRRRAADGERSSRPAWRPACWTAPADCAGSRTLGVTTRPAGFDVLRHTVARQHSSMPALALPHTGRFASQIADSARERSLTNSM